MLQRSSSVSPCLRGKNPYAVTPMIPLANRIAEVADSITLAVSAKARQMKLSGIDVVSFGAGEPDFDTPQFIKDAACDALAKGQTKYTPTPCIPELRKAIAEKFNRDNGLDYKPEQISTGAGGKQCLYMAFLATINPGDEVLIPSPFWVSYPEQAKLAGGVPVVLPGDEARGFKITPGQLDAAITPKTRVFMINSPSNPSGIAYTPAELKALADVLARHPNVWIFADEIYEKLIYDGLTFVSFASLRPDMMERTLTFNCHSKSFAMTGWRLGYVAGPTAVIAAINKLQSQISSHVTSFIQMPGAIALTDPRGAESRRADARAIRAARPAHVGAAQRAARRRLRPARGRVLLLPERQPSTSAKRRRTGRRSRMRSASAARCWRSATSRSCPATTAASTRTSA